MCIYSNSLHPYSTYIHSLGKTLSPVTGGMLSFCGGEILHSGDPVIEGVRYIIAAFCYVDLVGNGTQSKGTSGEQKQCNAQEVQEEEEKSQSFSFGFKM